MVDRADINSVLMQMRAMQAQAQQGAQHAAPSIAPDQPAQAPRSGFGELLKNAVDQVREAQTEAKNLATGYERGDPTIDLPQVMISAQKASVSFEAMTQVRNKLVTAYEDVMKMPI